MLKDPIARAIVLSGALVAAAILAHAWYAMLPRYELIHTSGQITMRLDRWTGAVAMCVPDGPEAVECTKAAQ
jgi:hypothetical protein